MQGGGKYRLAEFNLQSTSQKIEVAMALSVPIFFHPPSPPRYSSSSSNMSVPAPTSILSRSPPATSLHLRGPCLSSSRPSVHRPFVYKTYILSQNRCSLTVKGKDSRVWCSQLQVESDVDDEECELVNGQEVILGESTDSIRAYLLKAVKNNNETGILLLSDIYGFEDSSTRDFAYRIACNGYNVLVPDLFRGEPWKQGRPMNEFEGWLTRQPPERVAKDIALSTTWMADEFTAAGISSKLGVIGFCYGGGRLIETLAQDVDKRFGIGVCFYGSRMEPSLASQIKVPILFVSGDDDHLCPVNVLNELAESIDDSRVVIYSGRGHGFAHRPNSSEEDEDAENAFNIMRTWLHDGLLAANN